MIKIKKPMSKCLDCNKIFSARSCTRCHSCDSKRKGIRKWKESSKEKIRKEGNIMWKGDDVGYKSLHEWISNNKPKPTWCEECFSRKPYDSANISGKYKRDINDFKWLCRKCYMEEDGRLNNLKQFTKEEIEKNLFKKQILIKIIENKENKKIYILCREWCKKQVVVKELFIPYKKNYFKEIKNDC